jgi:hypothetical protein
MYEFNKMINRIKEMVETAAGYIQDNPEVEEFLAEGNFNTDYPWLAVIEYLGEVRLNGIE